MSQVYAAFYRGKAERFFSLARLSDWLTRQVTRGPYSHCELVERLPDGLFICYSSSVRDKGVRSKRMPLPIEKWDLLPINADPLTLETFFVSTTIKVTTGWVPLVLCYSVRASRSACFAASSAPNFCICVIAGVIHLICCMRWSAVDLEN